MATKHGIRWARNILKSLDKDILRLNGQLARGPSDVKYLSFKNIVPRDMRLIYPEVVYYSALHLIVCGAYPHLFLDRPFHVTRSPIINDFLAEMEESYPSMCFDFRPLTSGEWNVLVEKFDKE